MTRSQALAQLPARPLTFWGRVARALGSLMAAPQEFDAGADYAVDVGQTNAYPTESSMSAMAAFPWVRACVLAKAEDVSGLDVVVRRGEEEVTEGPVVDVLEQPSTRTTWRQLMRQWMVDYELTGNAYGLIVGEGRALSVLRMHPGRVRPIPQADGQIAAYEYAMTGLTYPWERVIHVRQPSWTDGPSSVVGEGNIRALHETLSADLAATRNEAKAAKRGRFEFLISPDDGDMNVWSKEMRNEVRATYQQMAEDGGGALVLGAGAKAVQLSATPADLQSSERRAESRDATLAVFSTPPSRVGLPTANFATQRQQMITHWESLRGGPIGAFEDALSWFVREYQDPRACVKFDLSEVDALQESKTERLQRVSMHILNGLDPETAYALEGFVDVKVAPVVPIETPPSRSVERASASRADVWRAFIQSTHGPLERQLGRQMAAFLREQRERIAARLAEVLDGYEPEPVQRQVSVQPSTIEAVVALADESTALRAAAAGWFDLAVARAFREAIRKLGIGDVVLDPTRSPSVVLLNEFVATVGANTAEVVRQVVMQGIVNGDSIATMQERLIGSQAFAPSRALRIARTETTRAVSEGAEHGYQQAIQQGVAVRKEWLSARDSAVRASHRSLDGQVVEVGESFRTVDGREARMPGAFGVASEDINCRCTTLPVLEDA